MSMSVKESGAALATPGVNGALGAERVSVIAALRHRNFLLFWSGQIISLIGTWMQTVAQGYLIYQLTGSSALLGLVSMLGSLPILLFTTVGGVVADRVPKRRLLVWTQSLSALLALILGILVSTNLVQVWHVMVLATALGVVNAFDTPTRLAFVVELVGKRDLFNAIALNSSIFNAARIVGPAVAGLLIARTGLSAPFLINAASYIAVIAGLLAMRMPPFVREVAPEPPLRRLTEGLRYIKNDGAILTILMTLGSASILAFNYPALLPAFASQQLHQGAQGLGLLYSALGVGAISGALLLAAYGHRLPRAKLFWSGAIAFALTQIIFAFSPNLIFAMIISVAMGLCMILFVADANTLVQTLVPDALRGRVMGVYTLVFLGSTPLGSLWAGLAAARFNSVPLVLAGGSLASLLVVGLIWALRPASRELTHEAAEQDQKVTATVRSVVQRSMR